MGGDFENRQGNLQTRGLKPNRQKLLMPAIQTFPVPDADYVHRKAVAGSPAYVLRPTRRVVYDRAVLHILKRKPCQLPGHDIGIRHDPSPKLGLESVAGCVNFLAVNSALTSE